MCLKQKTPKDNSAAIAREEEEKRQARITQGKTAIDSSFAQFDDPFYAGVSKKYTDYYTPQVQDQYKDALDQLTFNLGRQGILQSSAGTDKFGRLKEKLDTTMRELTDKSLATSQQTKADIENQKNQLYSLNTSAADPSLIASRASAAATGLNVPQTFSPIANVFAGLFDQAANATALQQQGYPGMGLPIAKPIGASDGDGTSWVVK